MNRIHRIRRFLFDPPRRSGTPNVYGVAVPAALASPPPRPPGWTTAPTAACPPLPSDQRRHAQLAGHPDHGHARAARLAAGADRVPDSGRAAAHGRQRRRTDPVPMIAPGMLPRTIQLCVHCQQRPAGFWVRRTCGTVVRRPWCLSCCQQLNRNRQDVIPFGG